jgi:GntR family transcriptional regulator
VSRVTLRVALAALESAQLIERRQGRGTFVRAVGATASLPIQARMTDLVTHMHEVSARTRASVVEFGYETGPAAMRALFGLREGEVLQRVVRVRRSLLDDRPVMHLTSYIREDLGRRFSAADLDGGSLFDVMIRRAKADLRSGEQAISATLADPTVAHRLQLEVGAPLLQVKRIHRDAAGEVVWRLEALASPKDLELRMSLGSDELKM